MAGLTEFYCGSNETSHGSQFKWLEYTFKKRKSHGSHVYRLFLSLGTFQRILRASFNLVIQIAVPILGKEIRGPASQTPSQSIYEETVDKYEYK